MELDISYYTGQGYDYTKAQGGFYPLMIEMSSESASHEYRTIYYIALTYNHLTQVCSPRVLKQKVIVNGQVFELSEAYGINSGN